MRIRKKKWVDEELEQCQFLVKNPKEFVGNWQSFFSNNNPIYVELGCGKGGFAAKFGSTSLDKNIITVDKVAAMLGLAKRKIEKEYLEKGIETNNICLVSYNIERISEIFNKADKIERIYINFCNPWPRGKHKKRRLTHIRQLEQYKSFLLTNGEVHFKTDDDELFEESLNYFKETGFELVQVIEDLHNAKYDENIVTEHEKMFSDEGIKIKFIKAKLVN